MFELVVTRPFGDYAVGQRITDPETVADVLAEHHASVVKVAAQPQPAPAKKAKAPSA